MKRLLAFLLLAVMLLTVAGCSHVEQASRNTPASVEDRALPESADGNTKESESATQPPTTVPTEPPATVPTEPSATVPTEPPTTVPTEPPTTVPTEPPTTIPTEPPATAPTESPTTKPTEPPTTAPIESPPDRSVPTAATEPETAAGSVTYVVNTNTGKFHYPSCSSVKQIKDENRWDYSGTRDYLLDLGYVPCKRCNP